MPAWELAPLGWEALATFTTGGLAVCAAYKVGRRQVKISKKQTEIADEMRRLQAVRDEEDSEFKTHQTAILGKQADIEAQKIKIELFTRRLAVYHVIRDWFVEYFKADARPSEETHRCFVAARSEAKFLFGDEVAVLMELVQHRAEIIEQYLSGNPPTDDVDPEARIAEFRKFVCDAAMKLPTLVEKQLNLSNLG
ncbi:hypothetical protein [Brevundimonas sp.]|uniref:hypothetical protein n=1 Tax=Brevundimonas sp. TaxID=1871086 RepID=UPI00289A66A9|nr:hypothetical protein [Brevundimonas sp.]